MKQAVGLRIDVDTVGGFTKGVVPLIKLLDRLYIKATFFIVTGQDNPLRGFPRLFSEKGFARRVLKVRGGIQQGAFGRSETTVKESIKAMKDSGHAVELHGFHHFRWQLHLKQWGIERVRQEIKNARESFRLLTGGYPHAFAAPGWETTDAFFEAEDPFGFTYASDIRGSRPCYPLVEGKRMETLQIPVTLPTLDELIALERAEELAHMRIKDGDVYCAHAEFDGITHLPLFTRFLEGNMKKECTFIPLAEIAKRTNNVSTNALGYKTVPGRSRMVTYQRTKFQESKE